MDDAHIAPVLSQVSPQVAAIIQLQRRTGMRPGFEHLTGLTNLQTLDRNNAQITDARRQTEEGVT